MNSAQAQVFSPSSLTGVQPTVNVGAASEPGIDAPVEQRWMRDLLVLQVTSIFTAGLFMALWFTH